MNNKIDCRGMNCPQPVINTKKYFDEIESGEAVVIVDNDTAKNNILKFASSIGLNYSIDEKQGCYYINLSKTVKCEAKDSLRSEESRVLTIVISNDKLGLGDDSLGAVLMKSYLYALSESDKLPKNLIFLNAGVKLTTEGSENIDNLKKLKEKGVEILSCGTCLDFYGLKEKLLIGEIGNMYAIVEKMNTSDNTIKL